MAKQLALMEINYWKAHFPSFAKLIYRCNCIKIQRKFDKSQSIWEI